MIQHFVQQASSMAAGSDDLFLFIFVVVGFWFLAAEAMFFYLCYRFRRKPDQKAQYITGYEHDLHRWISIPHYMVIFCDVFIVAGAVNIWYHVKQDLPPADTTIRVIGQQWAWTFVDPGPDNKLDTADDIATIDELHVQVGKTYHFELEAKDVLHSFSVPVFRLKQDAVPGRVITGWFKPTQTGTFDIQCTQICGIGHALMPAKLVIEPAEAHAAWLSEHQNGFASNAP